MYIDVNRLEMDTRDGPMRELGWLDGQNVVFEERAANERPELLPMLARELIASRVDVIVASPSTATRAAKEATATIPISRPPCPGTRHI